MKGSCVVLSAEPPAGLFRRGERRWRIAISGSLPTPSAASAGAGPPEIAVPVWRVPVDDALIGRPEQTLDGILGRCLLNPRIRPGVKIKIDQASINRLQISPNYGAEVTNSMIPDVAADGGTGGMGVKRPLLWLPLLAFALLLVVIAAGLFRPADRTVRSALVGQPLPAFALPAMLPGKPGVASATGGARLVNIFASWCVPCIAEAPVLAELAKRGAVIEGIAIRDRREARSLVAVLAEDLGDRRDHLRPLGDRPVHRPRSVRLG